VRDMDEIWRPIRGYEGIYEISSHWKVRSLDRYDRRGTFHKGKILKTRQSKAAENYEAVYVRLCKDGRQKETDIRYIILRAFEGDESIEEIIARIPECYKKNS